MVISVIAILVGILYIYLPTYASEELVSKIPGGTGFIFGAGTFLIGIGFAFLITISQDYRQSKMVERLYKLLEERLPAKKQKAKHAK